MEIQAQDGGAVAADQSEEGEVKVKRAKSSPGRDALWLWFGIDRQSWLTLPRVMMHDMPDRWQGKMAKLLEEWDATWKGEDCTTEVKLRINGKLQMPPKCLLNYKYPNQAFLQASRSKK